jgi:hypothetical protein
MGTGGSHPRSISQRFKEDRHGKLPDSSSEDESVEMPPPRKRTRRVKTLSRNWVESLDDNGNIVGLSPFQTTWYIIYVLSPRLELASFHNKFRRRFRLPYEQSLALVADAKSSGYFDRWLSEDATRSPSSPLEILILGALRYLGRGLTFVTWQRTPD